MKSNNTGLKNTKCPRYQYQAFAPGLSSPWRCNSSSCAALGFSITRRRQKSLSKRRIPPLVTSSPASDAGDQSGQRLLSIPRQHNTCVGLRVDEDVAVGQNEVVVTDEIFGDFRGFASSVLGQLAGRIRSLGVSILRQEPKRIFSLFDDLGAKTGDDKEIPYA